jgi:hypothetical protein
MSDRLKIAVNIPIGSLTKYGYQYQYDLVIDNLSISFDKVYLSTTTRENFDLNLSKYSNVELVVDEGSLFKIENNKEVFELKKLYNTLEISKNNSKKDGMDFLVQMAINTYITKNEAAKMRIYCEFLYSNNKPFGYYGKSFQIYDKVYFANTLSANIINLKHADDLYWSVDTLIYKGKKYGWTSRSIFEKPPFSIVDIYGVLTEYDYKNRFYFYEKKFMKDDFNIDIGEYSFKKEIKKIEKKVLPLVLNKNYKLDSTGILVMNRYPKNSIFKYANLKSSNLYIGRLILFCKKILRKEKHVNI